MVDRFELQKSREVPTRPLLVAQAATTERLLLRAPASEKQQPDCGSARCARLVVRLKRVSWLSDD
jgi:hypothetical protein